MNKKLYIQLLEREVETLRATVETRDEEIALWREDQDENLTLISDLEDKVEDLYSVDPFHAVHAKYADLTEKNLRFRELEAKIERIDARRYAIIDHIASVQNEIKFRRANNINELTDLDTLLNKAIRSLENLIVEEQN